MNKEELKQKVNVIVSDTTTSGNEKKELILNLFDVNVSLIADWDEMVTEADSALIWFNDNHNEHMETRTPIYQMGYHKGFLGCYKWLENKSIDTKDELNKTLKALIKRDDPLIKQLQVLALRFRDEHEDEEGFQKLDGVIHNLLTLTN